MVGRYQYLHMYVHSRACSVRTRFAKHIIPVREGGLGLTSGTAVAGGAYIGAERSLYKELNVALREIARIAAGRQLKDALDTSRVAVIARKEVGGTRTVDLLS